MKTYVSICWIENRKAYDMVLHSWIFRDVRYGWGL